MKAILINKHGKADVLEYGEVDDPKPEKHNVLVKLKAIGLNHVDIWVRNGIPAYPVKFPHVLGADGAGVIEKIGPEAEGLSIGDRVVIVPGLSCGKCDFCKIGRDNQCEKYEILGTKRHGTYAEKVLVPDQNVIPLPDEISDETAAAYPLAYLTAWHMLMGKAKLSEEETVYVVGGGSGVSIAAIQIAKWRGARVLASTTSPDKVSKIEKAGTNQVIVHNDAKSTLKWVLEQTNGEGVDVVVEHVGPVTWDTSVKILKPYGRLVTCGATTGPNVELDLRFLFSKDLSIYGAKMGTHKEFQQLTNVIFSGKISPLIDKVFPLQEAKDAHLHMENRQQVGKILLKP